MNTELMTGEEVLSLYREDVYKLAEYLPWLESKSGQTVSSVYSGDGLREHSVSFPVYDSTLLSFVKVAESTILMDRNYRYVYTRNSLHDHRDEAAYIDRATILQMGQLGGILSNYVLGGRTKAKLWSEGVTSGLFCKIVAKAKELIDIQVNATITKGE